MMNEIVSWLQANDKFLVITHERPDGDALGSAAALCEGLRSLGKTACAAENPDTTGRYIPYIRDYYAPAGYAFERVIAVDTPTRARLQRESRELPVDAAIDHHIAAGEPLAPLQWVETERAACGEMVYDILLALGAPLTAETALPLYLSLATDTGCFRHSNTTARTHEIAAALLRTGIDVTQLNMVMFSQKTRARLKIESQIYGEMRFHMDGKLALALLRLDDIRRAGAVEDDLDTLAALPRYVQGVEIGLLLREEEPDRDGTPVFKLSVRTSRDWRADRIAARFGGGGHARAAGASVRLPAEAAERALLEAVREARA
ncbi:MAG: DHH family phosphoesterase [Oscillospiraceae bacterium]|nr:DHH family phosphoesterase [Oscillospiraceae bacterium]